VDVKTGKVSVAANVAPTKAGQLKPQAVFLGDTIGFTSSDLVNEGGLSTGMRTMSVTMTNNFGLALGIDPNGTTNGLKIIFSPITNLTAPANLEPLTNISTFAGSGTKGNANGPSLNATFSAPQSVAINGQNVMYVADQSGTIRQVSDGSVTTLAGGGSAAHPDGLGSAAYFGSPSGSAINPVDGALIVADLGLNKIRRITSSGLVSTIAGTGTSGGTNGAGNVASFVAPTGVAVDASGNIYVAETNGYRIRKIAFNGGDPTQSANYSVTTLTGTGSAGSTDGPNGTATFHGSFQITLDGAGGLYVADSSNNKIRRVDIGSGAVTTIAGTGTAGDTDGNGAAATLNAPRGIVWSNGALFEAEAGGNVVRQLSLTPGASPSSASNWTVQTLAGSAPGYIDGNGGSAFFHEPIMLTASSSGALFVADSYNHVIRQVTPSTGAFPIGVVGGAGSSAAVALANPTGIEAGDADGNLLSYFLYPNSLASGATSQAMLWNFNIPTGVTAFSFTVTVVAATPVAASLDSGTGVASNQVYVRTIAGIPDRTGYADGPASGATFNGEDCTATDAAGNIFVGDTYNSEIRRISSSGTVTTIAGNPNSTALLDGTGDVATFNSVVGVAVTPDGQTLFVADCNHHDIRCVQQTGTDPTIAANWTVSTIVGNGNAGGNYSTDTTGDLATINSPWGIAYNANDHTLYFTESYGNRVRKATLRGDDPTVAHNWVVSLVAGDASAVAGAAALTNDIGSNARFHTPCGIGFDQSGNLYVGDYMNHAIRKITPADVVTTLAGAGPSSPGYIDAQGVNAKFDLPLGVAVDQSGNVFVADYNNSLIREVSPAGVVTTVAGTAGDSHVDGPGASAQLYLPVEIAIQPDGTLLIGGCDYDSDIRAISRSFSN
jgi:sugar lactone lactonase YvrE